jgi:Zn-dependent protease
LGALTITVLLGRALGLLLGFTIHEWAHAYSAYRLGDKTAYYQGRLTLDPRAHIDPIGIFLALLVGFGWAKPVPVNPRAFYPNETRGLMLVSLAGPVTNLIIAFVFGIILQLMLAAGALQESGFVLVSSGATIVEGTNGAYQFIYEVFATVVFFNLLLFLFNLIPLAPLDGWKIMLGLVPRDTAIEFSRYEQQSTYLLFFIILLGFAPGFNILGNIILPPLNTLFELFTGFGYYIG